MKTNADTRFKQSELGEVPEDWKVCRLKDIASVNKLTLGKSYEFPEIEYIDIDSVENGRIKQTQTLPINDAPSRAKRIIKDRDIIISTVRPNLRHFAFIKDPKPNTIVSTGFAVISAERVVPEFLYYCLTSSKYTDYLTAIADSHTSTYPAFNPDILENSFIPYPGDAEQAAIAKTLSGFDSKLELNLQLNGILERVAEMTFKHWFIEFEFPNGEGEPYKSSGGRMEYNETLGKEIPKGWAVETLGELSSAIFSGGTPNTRERNYWTGTHPWLSSGETSSHYIAATDKTITDEGIKNSSTRLARAGDLVVASAGQGRTRGQVSLLLIDTYINQSIIAIRPKGNAMTSAYLFLNLMGRYSELRNLSDSSSIRGSLTTQIFKELEVVKPPWDTLVSLDQLVTPLIQRIASNIFESEILTRVRDHTIPKLVTGGIRISSGVEAAS